MMLILPVIALAPCRPIAPSHHAGNQKNVMPKIA
jgi:hypothetical protein